MTFVNFPSDWMSKPGPDKKFVMASSVTGKFNYFTGNFAVYGLVILCRIGGLVKRRMEIWVIKDILLDWILINCVNTQFILKMNKIQ